MALVFQRKLAIPLWAIALCIVALAARPTATLFLMPITTVLAIAAVGIAAIVFLMPRPIPRLRTLDEPNRSTADDALDLVRMDDDGGWQLTRPPA